jgi:hypothetical protein
VGVSKAKSLATNGARTQLIMETVFLESVNGNGNFIYKIEKKGKRGWF